MKNKFNLEDLKVKSFTTSMNITDIKTLKGGSWTPGDVTDAMTGNCCKDNKDVHNSYGTECGC